MENLKQIDATPKSGKENLTNDGKKVGYSLFDFWQWSVSDILSNATRGRFAEFIVGTAVGINPLSLRDEWDAYDLTTDEGIKIEVKSAAYLQSWNQKSFSKISFSIKTARSWDGKENKRNNESKRHADLYVLCHLKHKDQDTIDPLKMEQWDFYVLPTVTLDNYERSQHSITLKSLEKLTNPIDYNNLGKEIIAAKVIQDESISNAVLKIDLQPTKAQLLEIKQWLEEEYIQSNQEGLFSNWYMIERLFKSKRLVIGLYNDNPIAFMTFNKNGAVLVIDLMGIKPSHRNKGLGKSFVHECMKQLKSEELNKVEVDCLNYEAEIFFQKIGFIKDYSPIVKSCRNYMLKMKN